MRISSWKKEMSMCVREQRRVDRFNISALYLALIDISKKYMSMNTMEEGKLFKVMLEDNSRLEFQFYKSGGCLIAYSVRGREVIVSKEDMETGNITELKNYEGKMKENNIGIGSPFPDRFKQIVKGILPGELLVFGNGKAYACIDEDPVAKRLKPSCKKTDLNNNPFIDLFKSYKTVTLHTEDWMEMQLFWSKVCDSDDDNLVVRIGSLTRAQETINKCTGGLSAGQTKKIDFGIISFHVKRSRLSKEYKWYLDNGKEIACETVKIIICWLNTAPVITDFKRNDNNAVLCFNDSLIKNKLNHLYKKKQYDVAYKLIMEYCTENKGTLKVSVKSLISDKEQYVGKSIVFTKDGAFSLLYPDGDFTKDAASVTKAAEQEFIEFCQQKYDESYIYIKNEKMAEIREQYRNAPEELAEKVAERATEMSLENTEADMGIEVAEEDVSTLVESFATDLENRFAEAAECANQPTIDGVELDDIDMDMDLGI